MIAINNSYILHFLLSSHVMPCPEILGNKDEIQARIFIFFTSMNAHDNIIQGSHRSQRKTSPTIQANQRISRRYNHQNHNKKTYEIDRAKRQMQTPGNWLSLKTEALRFPRIFTLARRGLKPISNDLSHILKYILNIRN